MAVPGGCDADRGGCADDRRIDGDRVGRRRATGAGVCVVLAAVALAAVVGWMVPGAAAWVALAPVVAVAAVKPAPGKKPSSIFCPFCNSRGQAQPVLSPMNIAQVTYPAGADVGKGVPFYSYRCQRCGYGEIHPVALT